MATSTGVPIKECEEIIQNCLSNNPTVKILVENLEKCGCKVGSNFIKAINCEDTNIRWSIPPGNYKIDDVARTLTHELVHAYDDHHGLANLDNYSSDHDACSEIRAYYLSGHCHYKELRRSHPWVVGNVKKEIEGYEQECLKGKAIESMLKMHYSEDEAKSVVETLWRRCRNNTAPFC